MKKTLLIVAAILSGWLSSSPTVLPLPIEAQPGNLPVDDFELFADMDAWFLSGQKLYSTPNAGNSWEEITPPITNEQIMVAVDFSNPHEGWIVINNANGTGEADFQLARTIDGGAHWDISNLNLFTPGDPDATFSAVYLQFLDSSTGWLVVKSLNSSNFSIGSLFRTSDGGETWERLEIPVGEGPYFISKSHGWVAGGPAGDELYSTVDGGESWKPVVLEGLDQALLESTIQKQVPAISPGESGAGNHSGFMPVTVTTRGQSEILLYQSPDSGVTWNLAKRIQTGANLSSGSSLPITSLDPERWLLTDPSTGHVWVFDGNTRIVIDGSQQPFLKGAQKIMTSSSGLAWASYWRGKCDSAGCLRQNGLLKFDVLSGNFKDLQAAESYQAHPVTTAPPLPNKTLSPSIADLSLTQILEGQGFDKCDMATVEQHQDWMLNGPYRSSNLYFGGIARACKTQAAMTKENLRTISELGWTFIPTWVGPQAPCTEYNYKISSNSSTAFQQGKDEADAAVEAAFNLGLTETDKSGTVIYYDMEKFDTENAACVNAVKSFINGWSSQVKFWGNMAGVYSTGSVLTQFANIANPLDVIWPANWYCPTYPDCSVYEYRADAHVWNVSGLSNNLWNDHQRIRQYAGGHNETWGSTTLKIDSNAIDGMVADIATHYRISVVLQGTGEGNVTSNPTGINCGASCEFVFEKGSVVTLQQVPEGESVFKGWDGICTGNGGSCQVTMDRYYQIMAEFDLVKYFYLPFTVGK